MAETVDGDAIADIAKTLRVLGVLVDLPLAAEVSGIDENRTGRIEFGDEGVGILDVCVEFSIVDGLRGAGRNRKSIVGPPGYIGAARRIDGNAIADRA